MVLLSTKTHVLMDRQVSIYNFTHIMLAYLDLCNWASSRQNLSLGSRTKRYSNQSPQLQGLARKLKFRLEHVWMNYFLKHEKQRR